MEYNLNLTEIGVRYFLMFVLGLIGGALQFMPLVVLGVFIGVSAIVGICPVYSMLGINRLKKNPNS